MFAAAASTIDRNVSPLALSVPKLGVGLAFQGPLRPFIEHSLDSLDFIEVVPDILWTDMGRGHIPRYIEDEGGVEIIRQFASQIPVVPHSIGLSIGSAHSFNLDHIVQMAAWHERLKFPWFSEHLSYNLAEHPSGEVNVGVTLPLPFDYETLELLSPRIAEIRSRIPAPFLLENNVYYFNLDDQDLDEAEFLNLLCRQTGCHLLLDLHNLYVNSRNHHLDKYEVLGRLELNNVIEIHLAGGMELDGFYMDAHSGPVPDPVWEMLEWTLPQCENIGGITFELFGSWYETTGDQRLTAELARMKECWARHQPGSKEVAA